MWGYPGKKLLFMGQEFGQGAEWNFADASLDWYLLDHPVHKGVQELVRELNRLLPRRCRRCTRATARPEGFRWIMVDDRRPVGVCLAARARRTIRRSRWSAISRRCRATTIASACRARACGREILNTDAADYGG